MQNSSIFRDAVFAFGKGGLGLNTRLKKASSLLSGPHGIHPDQTSITVTIEKVRIDEKNN